MKVLKSYGLGIRKAFSQGKMVLVLWTVNLLFAMVIYFVGRAYFVEAFGRSALGEALRKFDAGLFLETLVHNGASLGIMSKVIVLLALLYYVVVVFLTGGILHVLLSGEEPAPGGPGRRRFGAAFFQGAGRFFGRFLRLEVYSLILWVGFLLLQWIVWLMAGPITSDGTNEGMIFAMFWAWLALSLILIWFILMILDYSRIIIAREDTSMVWRSLREAVRFVFKKFFGTLALYYILVLTGAVIFLAYWGIHSRISTATLATIWLAFLVGQVFIISRGWLRIAFLAAQLSFYKRD